MTEKAYDRAAAVAYARRWALGRNPDYYSFSGIGGDCTSFVSQCIYAGAGVMNFTPVFGWYYISASGEACGSRDWKAFGRTFTCSFQAS